MTKKPDVKDLRNSIELMDSLSSTGLSEISAIARLALIALESPMGYQHPEIIANALRAIWGKADDIQNCINAEAESVGCNYRDELIERRYAAYRAVREADAVLAEARHG